MHQYLRLFCFLVLSIFLFAACQRAAVEEPQKENIVTVRLASDPENLNFILTADAKATEIFRLISMPMAPFDPGTVGLAPALIKQMPIATEITEGEYKGNIRYDFELLAEATWDDGSPITGEDLLFTLKTVCNPNYSSPHLSFTNFIKHVEIDENNPKKFSVYGVKYIIANAVISNFELMPKSIYDPKYLRHNWLAVDLTKSTKLSNVSFPPVIEYYKSPNIGLDVGWFLRL